MLLDDVAKALLGFLELAVGKRGVTDTERELRQKVLDRQEPFDSVSLDALVAGNDDVGRPQGAEPRAESA